MEDDEATAPALQPNFSSKSVTPAQLLKLQELHRRRLSLRKEVIYKKSFKKKTSGEQNGNFALEKTVMETGLDKPVEDHGAFKKLEGHVKENSSSRICKKRQKLHWGLDIKERWERKGNM